MKKNVIYFLLLCVLFGLILFWWKYMQYERMTQELLKENDMLKMEQTLLLENSMLQYSYSGRLVDDFRLYDECGHPLKFSELLDRNYKIVLKFSQYHCTSCVDYMLKELESVNSGEYSNRILIIGAYENKRLFQIVKKKYSVNIPFYFLRTEDDSDEILCEENMPYVCIINEERTVRDILIPIKEIPYHIHRYLEIVFRKYLKDGVVSM